MLSSNDVLGVLFVANREEKSFAPEEVALLSALADHASIILQTTQTLRDLRGSEDETRRTLESLTAHLAERDRANTVHQELVQAVLAGGGFAPVAETLASALGRAVAILDAHEQVIAAAGLPLAPGMLKLDDAVRDAIAESRHSGHCVSLDNAGIRAVAALSAGTQHFGALLLGEGSFELGAVDFRTIERAAQVGALLELQQEAVSGADHRIRSELIADILDDVPERRSDVERRARRLGVKPAHPRFSAAARRPRRPADRCGARSRAASRRPCAHRRVPRLRRRRVLLGPSAVRRRSGAGAGRTRHPASRRCVIPPAAPDALPETFTLSMRTARLLTALGITDVTASTDDFLPYSAVLDTDSRALTAFLRDTIGAVRRYDGDRNADLLGTLRAFVRNNASPTRTARALNFHTNTILQRLDRLDQVLGETWRDDERMFRISIAVRLDELRGQLLRASSSR